MASASTPQPSSREYYKPVKEEQDNDDEEVAENTATGASTAMVTITTTPREKMTVESCSTGEGVLVAVVSPLDDLLDCYRRCLPSASSSRQHRQNKRRKEGSPSSQQEQQPTPAVPLRGDNEKTATTKWRDPYPHEHRTNVSGDAETSASTYTQGGDTYQHHPATPIGRPGASCPWILPHALPLLEDVATADLSPTVANPCPPVQRRCGKVVGGRTTPRTQKKKKKVNPSQSDIIDSHQCQAFVLHREDGRSGGMYQEIGSTTTNHHYHPCLQQQQQHQQQPENERAYHHGKSDTTTNNGSHDAMNWYDHGILTGNYYSWPTQSNMGSIHSIQDKHTPTYFQHNHHPTFQEHKALMLDATGSMSTNATAAAATTINNEMAMPPGPWWTYPSSSLPSNDSSNITTTSQQTTLVTAVQAITAAAAAAATTTTEKLRKRRARKQSRIRAALTHENTAQLSDSDVKRLRSLVELELTDVDKALQYIIIPPFAPSGSPAGALGGGGGLPASIPFGRTTREFGMCSSRKLLPVRRMQGI